MEETQVIRPQEWYQEMFLSSPADIVIGWGAAGVGKTFSLLLECLRYIHNPDFGFVIFRRTTPQIRNQGWLRDESSKIFPNVWAIPRESALEWDFPSGARGKFAHLEYDKDIYSWQGSQITLEWFDELTHFTEKQFFYMLSRNRSTSGIKPYVRATCNPDPDSRVAEFIAWWIGEDWFPIPEREGVLRYFVRENDQLLWAGSPEELIELYPHLMERSDFQKMGYRNMIKSVTFIPGSIYQNLKLLEKDPGYLSNLMAQDEIEKAKLLYGNRKVRSDSLWIFEYAKLQDLFSNQLAEGGKKCATGDVARFGSDLAVIFTWIWWNAVRTDIWTKSSMPTLHQTIEDRKLEYGFGSSDVLCDEDGIGGGLVDYGYKGFKNGDPPINKENYKNQKTQMFYKVAGEVINKNLIRINLDNIYVDWVKATKITINWKTYAIKDLIIKHLNAIKRKNPDNDGKLQINEKSEQKALLSGMSPDFADAIAMRYYFEYYKWRTQYVF